MRAKPAQQGQKQQDQQVDGDGEHPVDLSFPSCMTCFCDPLKQPSCHSFKLLFINCLHAKPGKGQRLIEEYSTIVVHKNQQSPAIMMDLAYCLHIGLILSI
jgi:hypothetical protein